MKLFFKTHPILKTKIITRALIILSKGRVQTIENYSKTIKKL